MLEKKSFFDFASLRRFQMIEWKKKQKYVKGRQNLITFMSLKAFESLKFKQNFGKFFRTHDLMLWFHWLSSSIACWRRDGLLTNRPCK